ncbi:MAG: hypothetical protein JWR09_961 [Mucilaginibacter sp.]|nr:hypothetical protein [Mucilaginibacter sp.]
MNKVSLVIFTCEGRGHLLERTFQSFKNACNYEFAHVILAVDGVIDASVIDWISPDLVVYGYKRKGYVHSIKNTLVNIKTPYFFWLEDDWSFNEKINVDHYTTLLEKNADWAEVAYSKYGPLQDDFKVDKLGENLYANIYGYTANPGFNRTAFIKEGFEQMENAQKMNGVKEIGFENFLTAYLGNERMKCILIDPVDHISIAHEGYLESTPRNWHMLSSLDKKTEKHLLTIPEPSLARRLFMLLKLTKACVSLGIRQLWQNEIYDLCFRIIALNISTKRSATATADNHHSNR